MMGLKKPETTHQETAQAAPENQASSSETTEQSSSAEAVQTEAQPAMDSQVEANAVAPAQGTALSSPQGDFKERMANQGFGGLEVGFGSFPVIKLATEGRFIDSDENDHGTSFQCKLLSTRSSYVYKQKSNNDSDVYYSYDGVKLTGTTDGGNTTVEGLRSEWSEDGWEIEMKEYLEAVVMMQGDGEFADEMFLLSVAPSSRRKLAGVIAGAEFRGQDLTDLVIECGVGAKRKVGSNTYFPWAFKAVR